jgi:hypothetical protein
MVKRIASLRLADTPPHRPQSSLTTHWPCRSRPMNRQEVSVAWAALIFCWIMVSLVDSRGPCLARSSGAGSPEAEALVIGWALGSAIRLPGRGQRDHQKAPDLCEHLRRGGRIIFTPIISVERKVRLSDVRHELPDCRIERTSASSSFPGGFCARPRKQSRRNVRSRCKRRIKSDCGRRCLPRVVGDLIVNDATRSKDELGLGCAAPSERWN